MSFSPNNIITLKDHRNRSRWIDSHISKSVKLGISDPKIILENGYFIAEMPPGFDTNVVLKFVHFEFLEGLFKKNSLLVHTSGDFLFVPKDLIKINELLIKYSINSKRKKTAIVVDTQLSRSFFNTFINNLKGLSFELRVFTRMTNAKHWINE